MFACKEEGDFDVRSNITGHVQLVLIGWLLTVLHLCFFGLTIKSLAYTVLVSELGLTGVPVFNTNNNCSSASSALMLARLLVLSGQYECVLALGKVKCISRYHPITCKSTVMGGNLGFIKYAYLPSLWLHRITIMELWQPGLFLANLSLRSRRFCRVFFIVRGQTIKLWGQGVRERTQRE